MNVFAGALLIFAAFTCNAEVDEKKIYKYEVILKEFNDTTPAKVTVTKNNKQEVIEAKIKPETALGLVGGHSMMDFKNKFLAITSNDHTQCNIFKFPSDAKYEDVVDILKEPPSDDNVREVLCTVTTPYDGDTPEELKKFCRQSRLQQFGHRLQTIQQ